MNSYLLSTHAAVYVGRGSRLNANRPLLKIRWDVSRRQIVDDSPTSTFFRETDRNFRPMLFNISRSMVGNIGGKLDSGFIERRVANNSIRGERLKNYWQRLFMLMIHDTVMMYNYFCIINFVRGFMYNESNPIVVRIRTSLRFNLE